MSVQEMKALRERAKLTQAQMAERMGLGKTAYVDLELGDDDWKKFKHRHQLALERASLTLALERRDIDLALPSMRREALDFAGLVSGTPRNFSDFTSWLLDQDGRDDPIGDLARDAKRDPRFPHGSAGECLDYLSGRGKDGGRAALLEAAQEFLG